MLTKNLTTPYTIVQMLVDETVSLGIFLWSSRGLQEMLMYNLHGQQLSILEKAGRPLAVSVWRER